ncbi:MAG TPA: DUF885 family protein, partial [Polyangiaceae bacterium]
MRRPTLAASLVCLALAAADCGSSAPSPLAPPVAANAWIARSDSNARVLLTLDVEFAPERASQLGVEEADERTVDLGEGFRGRYLSALHGARTELEARRAAEHDPLVLGDLDILLHEVDLRTRETELLDRTLVPAWDVARTVFAGVHALLDDQVAPERRARAVARLRRYAGLVPGTAPLADMARADVAAHLARPELVPPARIELEKSLATSATLREGIQKLFEKYALTAGADEAL